jgi:hypothetical protein
MPDDAMTPTRKPGRLQLTPGQSPRPDPAMADLLAKLWALDDLAGEVRLLHGEARHAIARRLGPHVDAALFDQLFVLGHLAHNVRMQAERAVKAMHGDARDADAADDAPSDQEVIDLSQHVKLPEVRRYAGPDEDTVDESAPSPRTLRLAGCPAGAPGRRDDFGNVLGVFAAESNVIG